MFRKIFIATMFITATGYCFAADTGLPQVVTSQVFYDTNEMQSNNADDVVTETEVIETTEQVEVIEEVQAEKIPTWPIAGSDADMSIDKNRAASNYDNVKVVSKIGADLVVENNFNIGTDTGDTWSGGANMLHGTQLPAGFYDDCNSNAEMPLLNREMLEDDGGYVLSASRSGRRDCKTAGYKDIAVEESETVAGNDIKVDDAVADSNSAGVQDEVRSWVVANGQTLREVLQKWCDKEGWDLVWTTSREYPIEASAVFKGRFADVSSALVRNFSRATPIPYAKFYKGNRVLVISTIEE